MYMFVFCVMTCSCIILQEPGIEPGDVIFVLEEREHSEFKRKGSDLLMGMVSY